MTTAFVFIVPLNHTHYLDLHMMYLSLLIKICLPFINILIDTLWIKRISTLCAFKEKNTSFGRKEWERDNIVRQTDDQGITWLCIEYNWKHCEIHHYKAQKTRNNYKSNQYNECNQKLGVLGCPIRLAWSFQRVSRDIWKNDSIVLWDQNWTLGSSVSLGGNSIRFGHVLLKHH